MKQVYWAGGIAYVKVIKSAIVAHGRFCRNVSMAELPDTEERSELRRDNGDQFKKYIICHIRIGLYFLLGNFFQDPSAPCQVDFSI